MQSLWLALQFLTRLPTPQLADVTPQAFGRSLLFFPLVGLLIGALLFAANHLLEPFSALLAAALLLLLWVLLSGALHLDGLADMADAWIGGQGDRERTLEIMKDPASGPMGVSAVVVLLLLKFAALTEVLASATQLLLLSPLLGRSAALLLMLTTPYCRSEGLASQMVNSMPRSALWLLLLLIALIIPCWLGWSGMYLLGAMLVLYSLYRRALWQRLQGYTGDGAGALIELTEVVILIVGAVIIP
jgi:adenosylcobinamide-GDP ribazoletransferase